MMPPPTSADFEWAVRPSGTVLVCRAMPPVHGWTARSLELGEEGAAGWASLAADAGVPPERVARLRQVHGAEVVVVGPRIPTGAQEGDALVSRDAGALLTVRVADCVPLLVADPPTGAVAAVHAGWRGTAAGIARRAVQAMTSAYGSRPARLVAALGPSIGPCCYETGRDVREALVRAGWEPAAIERWFQGPERRHLDLWTANADQLAAAGLRREAIHVAGLCTACHPGWFPSYRREGAAAGRMAAYIRALSRPG